MKNSDKIQKNSDFPSFLTEDWLEKALKRLDEGNMTPDQRMFYNMAIAKNASIIQMEQEEREIWQEEIRQKVTKEVNEKVRKEVSEEIRKEVSEEIRKKVNEEIKEAQRKAKEAILQTAQNLKNRNMPLEEIAEITGLNIEELKKL